MKQTAINWFANELLKNENIEKAIIENFSIASEYYNKAKEMEKEQIENAYWDGGQDIPLSEQRCKQYYNETFKSE